MKKWLFLLALLVAAFVWWPRTPPPGAVAAVGSSEPGRVIEEMATAVEAPTAAPAPVASAKPEVAATKLPDRKPLSPSEFNQLFEKLDACELISQGVASRAPLPAVALKLFRSARYVPPDKEVSQADASNLFGILAQKDLPGVLENFRYPINHSYVLRFFIALFQADLLSAHLAAKPDYMAAYRILADAEPGLGGNGAVPFFRASFLLLGKAEERAAIYHLQRAMKSGRFETYLSRIARMVFESGLGDPKLFALSLALVNQLPHVIYEPSISTISKRIRREDPEWAQQALNFGQVLMNEGLQNGSRPSNIYWRKEEYDLGRDLARKAWEALNPENRLTEMENQWPLSTLFKGTGKVNPLHAGPFPPYRSDGEKCDKEAFRRYLNQLAEIAQEHQLGVPQRR